MKTRIILIFGLLLAPVLAVRAADEPAKALPTLEGDLTALVDKIKAKLATGARTEAAFTEELKGFDALLAAHQSEKSDAVAQVLMMKALLYVQVFADFDKGRELFVQITTDFPGTQVAQTAEGVVAKLDQQKAGMALQASLKPGAAFPDFSENDLAGEPLSIAKFKGKVVLVDFWATWCGPCVAELPNVLAAYQKYHAKGFEIVGISLDQSESALKGFIKDKGMTWPQYFDGKGWESKLGKQYGVTSIPATFLLDANGRIVAKDLRGPVLEEELERLLGEKKS